MERKRTGRTNCCVVGCHSTYSNSDRVKLYSFPYDKWHYDRRMKWIQAVKRLNCDGSNWTPAKHSRICSNHFVDGAKSDNPSNPAYIPTIFPYIHNSDEKGLAAKKRFDRHTNTKRNIELTETQELMEWENLEIEYLNKSVATQTDFTDYISHDETMLLCFIQENCSATQTNIKTTVSTGIQTGFNYETKDACVGSEKTENFFNGYASVEDNEDALKDFTGVTKEVFTIMLTFLTINTARMALSSENLLLLFLMKMKYGLSYTLLAKMFGIHRTTAGHNFKLVLNQLFLATKKWLFWPNKYAIKNTMPDAFKIHYPNCTAIIDCTEIFCETPTTVHQRIQMYSSYKSNFTLKYLIGITPSGFISFISQGFGGKCTDSYITVNSGILKYITPGDIILADKGFPQIKTSLEEHGAILVMPPFAKSNGSPFTADECAETYNIASVRIHVERAIQRIKLSSILKKISIDLIPEVDKIIHMAAVFANLQPPIIKQ